MGAVPPEPWTARIALVVVTRDRAEVFARCALPGILEAASLGVVVAVVDQSGDDATGRLLADVTDVRYEHPVTRGLSRGRNQGLAVIDAPIVAFADDDVVFDADWLRRIVAIFDAEPSAGAVCGDGVDPHGARLPGGRPGVYNWPTNPFALGSGFNMAVRRDALAAVGDFDVDFGAGAAFRSADDTEILHRILRAGWSVVCSDAITVTHDMWHSGREELDVHFAYGYGAGAQWRKHRGGRDVVATRLMVGDAGRHIVTAARSLTRGRLRVARIQLHWLRGLVAGFARAADLRPPR